MATVIIRPDGMGNVTQLLSTPSIGARWQHLDEVSPNDSTIVRWNADPGSIDEYTFTNHSRIGSEAISLVTVNVRARVTIASVSPHRNVHVYTQISGAGTKDHHSFIQVGTSYAEVGFGFTKAPDGSDWTWDDIDNLYVGLELNHNNGGETQVSQLFVEITFAGPFNYTLTANPAIGAKTDTGSLGLTQQSGFGRTLEAEMLLDTVTGSLGITRAATYSRTLAVITGEDFPGVGLRTTLITGRNLATWLVVASSTNGTTRTRFGTTWVTAAFDDSPLPVEDPVIPAANPARGAWLAQFDNRLCLLAPENAGFVYSSVNDIVSEWTQQTYFPNLPIPFTGMFTGRDASDNPALFFLAHDGVYYLDVFSTFVFGKTELTWEEDITSGKKGMYFKGATYVTTGKGIYELVGGIATPIGPDADDGLPDEIAAPIADMIGIGFWIVIAINGSAGRKSVIMKRHINGKHWHTVYKTSSAGSEISALFWDSGTLYFGEGINVKSLPFSNANDNVKLTPDHTVQSSGSIIYPWYHSPFEATPKLAIKLRLVSEDMTSDQKVTASYRIDSETSFTSLGTFTSSPRPTALSFGTANIGVPFERFQLKLEPARGSTTTDRPITVSVTLDYIVQPDVIYKWRFKAHAVTTSSRKGQVIIDALATAVAKKELKVFYPGGDKSGTSYLVEVTGLPRTEKGTDFGVEGDYDVEVSMVTET